MSNCKNKIKALMFVITFLASSTEVYAASYIAYPFESGSWVKYEVYAWSNAIETPPLVIEANNMEWDMFTVDSASNIIVTLNRTTKFKMNETEMKRVYNVNVVTGTGIEIPIIIASNLKEGDYIFYPSQTSISPRINRTSVETFLGKNREINYAFWSDTDPLGETGTISQFFWDKETGILCEVQMLNSELESEGVRVDTFWKMKIIEKSQNLWENTNVTTIFAVAILMIVSIFAIFFLIRKKI
jgi:hypothetical protein